MLVVPVGQQNTGLSPTKAKRGKVPLIREAIWEERVLPWSSVLHNYLDYHFELFSKRGSPIIHASVSGYSN